jgi:hypothetical protein
MQLQNFAKLAFYAKNNGASFINMSQLGVGISGVKPIEIMLIGLVDIVIFLLLLTYLWPLFFKIDPEKNLRFYYPFTCSYWCEDENQAENNREIGGSLNQSLMNGNSDRL